MNRSEVGTYNNSLRTCSGLYLSLIDPQPEQVTLADIACGLSKLCRFGGQIEDFYSVAEHACHCYGVAVSDGLPQEAQRAVFLHDAAEAFVGDVIRPLKNLISGYKDIENRILAIAASKWRVDFGKFSDVITEIDTAMLFAERRLLFTPDDVVWVGEAAARRVDPPICCWTPPAAEAEFVRIAAYLGIW